MAITIRPAVPADTAAVGRILYAAFTDIAERHNFPSDFSSLEVATQVAGLLINQPSFYGIVAERDGRVIGSNFLAERDAVRAVGPISVDPTCQQQGTGRVLMEAVLARARSAAAIRLVQDAFNTTSMSLYASLGFDAREPLVLVSGKPVARASGGVRPLVIADLPVCSTLCHSAHGIERNNELLDAMQFFRPLVVERDRQVRGYATTLESWKVSHAVAASEEDLCALIAGAVTFSKTPLSFLLPIRQAGLFRWCLGQGFRVIKPMTLMTIGDYQEPQAAYLPSVAY